MVINDGGGARLEAVTQSASNEAWVASWSGQIEFPPDFLQNLGEIKRGLGRE